MKHEKNQEIKLMGSRFTKSSLVRSEKELKERTARDQEMLMKTMKHSVIGRKKKDG